jgi:hypothetical protein
VCLTHIIVPGFGHAPVAGGGSPLPASTYVGNQPTRRSPRIGGPAACWMLCEGISAIAAHNSANSCIGIAGHLSKAFRCRYQYQPDPGASLGRGAFPAAYRGPVTYRPGWFGRVGDRHAGLSVASHWSARLRPPASAYVPIWAAKRRLLRSGAPVCWDEQWWVSFGAR